MSGLVTRNIINDWRAFNYVFIVVYPPEREAELYQVLGNWANESWAIQNALNTSEQEASSLTGIDQFFAWFNKGTNYGLQTDYGQSALAYDQAFNLYGAPSGKRSSLPHNVLSDRSLQSLFLYQPLPGRHQPRR